MGTFSPVRRESFQSLLIFLFGIGWIVPGFAQTQSSYHRVQRGSVFLYFQEGDRAFAETAAGTIQKEMPDVVSVLGMRDVPEVHVVVAESDAAFRKLTDGSIPDWGVGAADPGSGFIFLKSPRIAEFDPDPREIVVHELAHVLLGQAMEGYMAPRWFDEGLAQMLSGERRFSASIRLARTFTAGKVLWFDQIDDVLTYQRERAALAYETAHSAVVYLVQTHGEGCIKTIVHELAAGRSMDVALQAAIGKSQGEFESGWYEAMRRRYRWAVFLDFPVLLSAAFVILLGLAFWRTQVRVRAKRRLWEIETQDEIQDPENDTAPY